MNKQDILALLKQDVVPALGCTEPVCVALAAAKAGQLLEDEVTSITVYANTGIYKNGMSAGIPNCDAVGLPYAAALGALLRNPEKKLELLEDITAEILREAKDLVEHGVVSVNLDSEASGLYVRCELCSMTEKVICQIQGAHTNIVYLEKNGQVLFNLDTAANSSADDPLVKMLLDMKISEIRDLVDCIEEEELEFMLDGVEMNERLAQYSMSTPTGVGIADALRKEAASGVLQDNLISRIISKVSSAAESRLDGCPLPTMSSSGAGTKGLVVILPVSETADYIGASKEKKLKALALAHLINRYINANIGKLSPMCSCVMASSTASAVGIAYLLGGTNEQLGHTIRNMAGSVTGMICDGGKVGCALKVSVGSAAAVISAITAVNGAALRVSDGICAETPEDCIRNMALVGTQGMADTDCSILEIMTNK